MLQQSEKDDDRRGLPPLALDDDIDNDTAKGGTRCNYGVDVDDVIDDDDDEDDKKNDDFQTGNGRVMTVVPPDVDDMYCVSSFISFDLLMLTGTVCCACGCN